MTVAEMLAEKERRLEELKRRAAREEQRLRKVYQDQEVDNFNARMAQAVRDREWEKARPRRPI